MTDSARMKVLPVRGASGHIQGWAIISNGWEHGFCTDRIRALNLANGLVRVIRKSRRTLQ